MIISNNLVKSDKIKGKYNKKVTATMTIIGLIYIAIMYMLGIYIGFYNATVKLSTWSLINYIIPYIVIIISTENIRIAINQSIPPVLANILNSVIIGDGINFNMIIFYILFQKAKTHTEPNILL